MICGDEGRGRWRGRGGQRSEEDDTQRGICGQTNGIKTKDCWKFLGRIFGICSVFGVQKGLGH